jgi:hypothetical protein
MQTTSVFSDFYRLPNESELSLIYSHRAPQARYFGSQLMVFEQQLTDKQMQVVAQVLQRRHALLFENGESFRPHR